MTAPITVRCLRCSTTAQDFGQPLKQCSRCHLAKYCSRDCQTAHWSIHKATCKASTPSTSSASKVPNASNSSETSGSSGKDANSPFEAFNTVFSLTDILSGKASVDDMPVFSKSEMQDAWNPVEMLLHTPPRKQAMVHLIDAYRMRVEDEYVHGGGNLIGLYNQENPIHSFKYYLNQAEKRKGLLPKWWDKGTRAQCIRKALGEDGEDWARIEWAVEKDDVMEHYGDRLMPMRLRRLAEKVYEVPHGSVSK